MKVQNLTIIVLFVAVLMVVVVVPAAGAQSIEERIQFLEHQVDRLATTSLVLFLYGFFCALWAQRTGRNAWVWFFLGLFFGPFTSIVLLIKNSEDKKTTKHLAGRET